jgi:methionine-rich copper-binding protein CopC
MTFSPTASVARCSVIEKLRRLVLHLAAMAAIGMAPAVALAHAFLNQAIPPVGGTVPASPKEIRLTFSEGIEPRFSGIDLATDDGRTVATGAAAVDPANDKQLVLAVPPLVPGRYRVHWHVVSVDTHRTEGEYSFVVEP